MKQFEYVIVDELGLHTRPAGLMVKEASRFRCGITLSCNDKTGSAKKLFNVMAMGAKKGEKLIIRCEGEDEDEAAAALKAFCRCNL